MIHEGSEVHSDARKSANIKTPSNSENQNILLPQFYVGANDHRDLLIDIAANQILSEGESLKVQQQINSSSFNVNLNSSFTHPISMNQNQSNQSTNGIIIPQQQVPPQSSQSPSQPNVIKRQNIIIKSDDSSTNNNFNNSLNLGSSSVNSGF